MTQPPTPTLKIDLPARRIAVLLGGLALLLAALSIGLKALEWAAGTNSTYWLYHISKLFSVNREGNIPTWYNALLLVTAALLLAQIALYHRGAGARPWFGLAAVFVYLSVDEAAGIHERTTIPLQEGLNLTGPLYFGWVLIGIGFVLVMAAIFGRFVWRLPPATRRRFILAAVIYLSGALVVESISANRWYVDDGTSLAFSAIGTVEELLEMWGVVVLIYALLRYLGEYSPRVTLHYRA